MNKVFVKVLMITMLFLISFSCSSNKEGNKVSTITLLDDTKLDVLQDSFGKFIILDIEGIKQTFRLVPAGEFMMGSNSEDKDEAPSHKVKLSSFFIADSEVTQELWEKIMLNNPSKFKGKTHPVEHVSWNNCNDFINELNILYPFLEFSLPTEAQWEYIARAGSKENVFPGKLDNYSWYSKNSEGKTHPVKQKRANPWGVYDVLGNVWEWCSDWYNADYYNLSILENPQGAFKGISRVFRGGSWGSDAKYFRFSTRGNFSVNNNIEVRGGGIGLRLVLKIVEN